VRGGFFHATKLLGELSVEARLFSFSPKKWY
jgi:hypothetical protein